MHDARTYYEIMLNSLSGMDDDLIANSAPKEAVWHLREAIRLCKAEYYRRFT